LRYLEQVEYALIRNRFINRPTSGMRSESKRPSTAKSLGGYGWNLMLMASRMPCIPNRSASTLVNARAIVRCFRAERPVAVLDRHVGNGTVSHQHATYGQPVGLIG
jgi:hypothetical protein